jgi:hypothetical protein
LWPFATVMGPKASVLLAAAVLAYFFVALFPIAYPAIRAARGGTRLPQAKWFVFTVACLSYGAFTALFFCVSLPIEFYMIFVAPQLQEMGQPYGSLLVKASRFMASYGWLVLPFVLAAFAFKITQFLYPRWPAVALALRG